MAEASEDLVDIGSVLRDTYEVAGVLGKGGMGTVYLARHLRLPGKLVAVKVLQGGASAPELHARFKREAEIVSRLAHPNVVEVLDYDTLPKGTPYLVLEHLRGESLHARLRRGPIDAETTFSIVRQVGSALHAAHRAGIVHRDLKPDNIFLIPTDSGGVVGERVKLLDFGISKLADSDSSLQTRDAVLIGTPQYMAPEQAMGKNSEIDARTDVFALGCIVYEMLSGKGPFAGTLIAEVVYKVVHAEPKSLAKHRPELSAQVVQAVERAMKKDPAARYPSVAAFVADLTGSALKTLSDPALPVTTPARELTESGISLSTTLKPPSFPTSPTSNERPRLAPPVPSSSSLPSLAPPRRAPRGVALGLAIAAGTALGSAGALYFRARQAPPADPVSVTPAPPEPAPEPEPASARAVFTEAPPERRDPLVPQEVLTDIDAAEAALARGDGPEAIRLAKQSQRVIISGQSYSVLVRAHCQQKDAPQARAQWPNVPPGQRRSVQDFCSARGIDL